MRCSISVERLPELFHDWEGWAAEVLDSHVAFPLLGFFRSSHDNLSWISALGTVLDASSLVLTTVTDVPRGEAKLFKRMGTHLVEDIFNLGFRAGQPIGLEREAFDAACDRLADAGYALAPRDKAWAHFEAARATYSTRLEAMASTGRRRPRSGSAIRSCCANRSTRPTIRDQPGRHCRTRSGRGCGTAASVRFEATGWAAPPTHSPSSERCRPRT